MLRTVTAAWLLIGGLAGAWVVWSRSTEGRLCARLVEAELTHYRKEAA